jgi:RNA polymerase sigma-70 factor (ECF subfamily)
MNSPPPGSRLSQISTLWSVVQGAHEGPEEAVRAAQAQLLARYGNAIHRYLLAALRDEDAANEVAQEFAVRLLDRELSRAQPHEGRFRYFVKGVLLHLIADYHRRRKKEARIVALDGRVVDALGAEGDDSERMFQESWRDEVLARGWDALARSQPTGGLLHSVLRFRVQHPKMHSQEMAEQLTAQLGKELTAVGVRQLLHRARIRFAELLLDEVAQTLQAPTRADLEQELSDLGLLRYCRSALSRYGD